MWWVRCIDRPNENQPVHETAVVVVRARFRASSGEALVCLERKRVPEHERHKHQNREHAGDQPPRSGRRGLVTATVSKEYSSFRACLLGHSAPILSNCTCVRRQIFDPAMDEVWACVTHKPRAMVGGRGGCETPGFVLGEYDPSGRHKRSLDRSYRTFAPRYLSEFQYRSYRRYYLATLRLPHPILMSVA